MSAIGRRADKMPPGRITCWWLSAHLTIWAVGSAILSVLDRMHASTLWWGITWLLLGGILGRIQWPMLGGIIDVTHGTYRWALATAGGVGIGTGQGFALRRNTTDCARWVIINIISGGACTLLLPIVAAALLNATSGRVVIIPEVLFAVAGLAGEAAYALVTLRLIPWALATPARMV